MTTTINETVNGGNEATQLLRKMINCRTLGIPFSPQLHLQALDQPMALFKVFYCAHTIHEVEHIR